MFHYSTVQWLFIFYTYCFLGWCFESAYVSLKSKKWINRGFMRGPFLPLYGSGAVMMLVVSMPFRDSIPLTYVAGCVGATVLEYVTGVTMEALFKVRYWDYSNQPFNFQGQICLGSTLTWGLFTVLMTRVLHYPIDRFVMSIPPQPLFYITTLLTVYLITDFTLAFKAALDIRVILVKMERVKEEMQRMQKRLDVIIAFNNDEKKQQERELSFGELRSALKHRFSGLKETIQSKPSAFGASVREEIAELRGRFSSYPGAQDNGRDILDFYKRDMIRNNPSMVSRKYNEMLDELKRMAAGKKKKESGSPAQE